MRNPYRFWLCLAALLLCQTDSQAQRKRAPGRARQSLPAPLPPKAKWQILTQTYAEDGEAKTLISLQPLPLGVPAEARYWMSFGINYGYTENDPARVSNISLNFFARAPTCHFPADSTITFSFDAAHATLPYQPKVKGADGVFWVANDPESGNGCNESLGAFVSRATLIKLAAARSIGGAIGDETFQFTADDLAALRDLVSRIAPPQRPASLPQRRVRR